jgi:hypothetical protein
MRIEIRARSAAPLLVAILALVPRVGRPQGGDPLGPEFRVNTTTTQEQTQPSVAADASGNFVVTWTSESPIFGQRYAGSGAPLGAEFLVSDSFPCCRDSSVATDSAGNFVVVWLYVPLGQSAVLGRRFSSSGDPLGNTFFVGGGYSYSPVVAGDPAGNFTVVWANLDAGSGKDVIGRRYDSSGSPLGSAFLVNTSTTSDQERPSVAADAAGNFIVVWSSYGQDGSSEGVFGQRYLGSGTPLGPEFRVNSSTGGPQDQPSVAADAAGNFVVAWAGNDGSTFGIFGQRYASSGAPLGSEFRVNTYTTNIQYFPSIAADSSGNFVVVWDSFMQDGDDRGVFGQRYAASGVPLGPEFRVSTYTTSLQALGRVASDPTGNFVVVWESLGQDGSSYGVYGQRYSQILPVELMRFAVE